jgi:hypothetical protein
LSRKHGLKPVPSPKNGPRKPGYSGKKPRKFEGLVEWPDGKRHLVTLYSEWPNKKVVGQPKAWHVADKIKKIN